MIRDIDLIENKISATLMRNRREILSEIDPQYITRITYDISTYSDMTMEIPKYVTHNNGKVPNGLYDTIKGKMLIILTINNTKTKFIIDDNIEAKETSNEKVKIVKAFSYEKTLQKKNFLIGSSTTRQLYMEQDETVELSDGVLNWLEETTSWRVGEVQKEAKKEFGQHLISRDKLLASSLVKHDVLSGDTLWDREMDINVENSPINITISYPNMEYYYSGVFQKKDTLSHEIPNLPYPIKHITAKYINDDKKGHSIHYRVSMLKTSDEQIEKEYLFPFINMTHMVIKCEKVRLSYTNGDLHKNWGTKYRYFEECSTNWYDFLMNDVAESFNVVFMFDTYNQIINVYSKDDFGKPNGLYMSYDNVIEEINKKHMYGDIVTRLTIESPHASISSENPLGSNYVECYDYFKESGIMTRELSEALSKYEQLVEQKHIEFLELNLEKTKGDQKLSLLNNRLLSLETQLKGEQAILSAYVISEDVEEQKKQSLIVKYLETQTTEIQHEIREVRKIVDTFNGAINRISKEIGKNSAMLNGERIFTNEDLHELEDYTIEGSVQDDTCVTSYSLYKWALESVKNMNAVQIDFTITTKNLIDKLMCKDGWNHTLKIGDKIELDDMEVSRGEYVQLCGFEYSPSAKEVKNLKFTNNKKAKSPLQEIASSNRKQKQTTSLTTSYKDVWKVAKESNDIVEGIASRGLDVANSSISGRNDVNRVQITDAGVYVADNGNTDNEIYIGHGLISATDDGWATSRTVLDGSGVIADSLFGAISLGENLFIGNNDSTFEITQKGIRAYAMSGEGSNEKLFLGVEKKDSITDVKFRLRSPLDNRVVLSESGVYGCYQVADKDDFDYANSFKSPFYIPSNLKEVFEAKLVLSLSEFVSYVKEFEDSAVLVEEWSVGCTNDYKVPPHETYAIPECEAYINGNKLNASLNVNNQSIVIDVTNEIKGLSEGVNSLEIRTTDPRGLARGSFILHIGGFFNYN